MTQTYGMLSQLVMAKLLDQGDSEGLCRREIRKSWPWLKYKQHKLLSTLQVKTE